MLLKVRSLKQFLTPSQEEEIFDPKNCMIDFALQSKIIKTSDNRLADDGFIYKDWSLGVYDKARNTMQDPLLTYKKETYKKDSLEIYLRKIRPSTICLYSAASIWFLNFSADFQSASLKSIFLIFNFFAILQTYLLNKMF